MNHECAARFRVLLLEGDPVHAELVLHELKRAGIDAETIRVFSREDFEALLDPCPDAILSDSQLPQWTGLGALQLVRQRELDVPFIIVSSAIDEDAALEAMREGADDCLFKDQLTRLGPSLERALARKQVRTLASESVKALREREAGLHQAQLFAKLAHAVSGPDGSFSSWWETLPQLIGVDPARMPKSTREWLTLLHPDDRARFRNWSIEAGKVRRRAEIEYRLQHGNGAWILVRHMIEPLQEKPDSAGRTSWFNTVQDVTEQKRAGHELQRLSIAIRQSGTGIVITSPGGVIEFVNPKFEAMTGYSAEEIKGKNPRILKSGKTPPQTYRNLWETITAGKEWRGEIQNRKKTGEIYWEKQHISPVFDDKGGILNFIAVKEDITELKRAEEEQRSVLQLLDNIVENIPTAVQLKSVADGYRVVLWNKAAEDMYGVPREDAIGRNVHDLWPRSDADRFHAADLELVASGRMQDFPDRAALTKGRGEIRVHMRKVALLDDAGKATHLLVIADDITAQLADQARLRVSEARFRSLTTMSSDFYWETDAEHRLALRSSGGTRSPAPGFANGPQLGKRGWEIPHLAPDEAGWQAHRAALDAHLPFRDFEFSRSSTDGAVRHFSVSGEPVFDASGEFRGYRGVGSDISERKQASYELQRFRMAMDVSADSIYLTDPATMRFVYLNDTACQRLGYSREELLRLGPQDVIAMDREEIRREYNEVIAAGDRGLTHERRFVRNDRSEGLTELHRRALRTEGGTLIVTIGRDITERKLADDRVRRLNRVYAVLSGINSAIVRVRDQDELFAEACRIAVADGGFLLARVIWLDENGKARVAATTERDPAKFVEVLNEFNRDPETASSLLAQVLRTGQTAVSNDVASDPRVHNRAAMTEEGGYGLALLPLIIEKRIVGAIALRARAAEMFDEEEMRLLRELAGDVSYALENIEQADRLEIEAVERAHAEIKVRRLNRVYAVLSGINALIARTQDRAELFREACRIVIDAGKLALTYICVVDAAEQRLVPVASAGADEGFLKTMRGRNSLRDDASEGHGPPARAVRERRAIVVNDVATDPQIRYKQVHAERGICAVAILPLFVAGEAAGVFGMHSAESGFFDEEEMKLLNELASNLSFALDGIEKAERLKIEAAERLRAEVKVERLNRVYAVLSGINAAIVRVEQREELFREACRIAVEAGRFLAAWIGIVDRNSSTLDLVAWRGLDEEYIRAMPVAQRVAFESAASEKIGLAPLAIQQKKPMIAADIATDPRVLLRKEALDRGFRSLAILPLIVKGDAVGVMALYAAETNFFNEEEMKLLNELAGDISYALDHIEKSNQLNYLAYFDSLTGIANRSLFHERLSQYTHAARQREGKLALVLANVDRFRSINDSLGRSAGDELLKQLAGRLASAADPANVARIGADHFALVLPEIKGRSAAARSVERIWRACFAQSFQVAGTELRIAAKAGIALFPSDGVNTDALFSSAEAALQKAQQTGERQLFHTPELTAGVADQLALENRLRQALEKNEFVLHYQPKIDSDSREIVAVEALIRWQSPELGLVPPLKFIPLMEETGLILEVGAWALKRASLDHRNWIEQGLKAPRIAVNVSPIQLRQRDFVSVVEQAISEGVAPTGIDLEITESLIMADVQSNIGKLKAVRALGVRVAIDDFGTGYSSLGYLSKLPVQTLKIDRSFIITMLLDPDTMSLVQTIISLAHSMRLEVVAEGVDSEEQAKMLRLLRCDQMQGYLFSRPVPVEQLAALLEKEKRN